MGPLAGIRIVQRGAPRAGKHTDEALADWGSEPAEIASLRAARAIA